MAKKWQYALVALLSFGPVAFEALPGLLSAPVLGPATLLVPFLIARYRLGHRGHLRLILIGGSTALGIFSITSGYLNYLTEEWSTPQYVSLFLEGHNWYATPLNLQYVRMGMVLHETLWNVWLPMLPFVQVPYFWLDYRWFMLGLWGLTVYLVRNRYYTSVALGGQYPALMAANGFNDSVPILFLTVAFVTLSGRRSEIVRFLCLGLKQFANVFVFAYYILHRDWSKVGLTVLVSALFLSPFLVWDWKSAICAPILDMPPDCQGTQNLVVSNVHSDINFALWPVWAVAIFYPRILSSGHPVVKRLVSWTNCLCPAYPTQSNSHMHISHGSKRSCVLDLPEQNEGTTPR